MHEADTCIFDFDIPRLHGFAIQSCSNSRLLKLSVYTVCRQNSTLYRTRFDSLALLQAVITSNARLPVAPGSGSSSMRVNEGLRWNVLCVCVCVYIYIYILTSPGLLQNSLHQRAFTAHCWLRLQQAFALTCLTRKRRRNTNLCDNARTTERR